MRQPSMILFRSSFLKGIVKIKVSGEAAEVFRFLLSQKEVGFGAKPHKVNKYNSQRSGQSRRFERLYTTIALIG